MATYQIPVPEHMALTGSVSENWKDFEKEWNYYVIATGLDERITNEDNTPNENGKRQVAATLIRCMGRECFKVLEDLPGVTDATKTDPALIIEKLRGHFVPKSNVLYERFLFNSASQLANESVDQFLTRIRKMASSCEFGTLQDSLLRDRLVIGTSDEPCRERMLREMPVPDLERCLNMLRSSEASRTYKEAIAGKTVTVNQVCRSKKPQNKQRQPQPNGRHDAKQTSAKHTKHRGQPKPDSKCTYCGGSPHDRKFCPAKNAVCHKCKRRGHFGAACLSNAVNEVINTEPILIPDPDGLYEIAAPTGEFWSANVKVDGWTTTFKMDSAAKGTILSDQTPWLKHVKLDINTREFHGAGGVSLTHLVLGQLDATLEIGNRTYRERLYVMRGQHHNLLSKKACQALKLLIPGNGVYTVEVKPSPIASTPSTPDFLAEFPQLFGENPGLLKIPPVKIRLKADAQPFCLYTPRKVAHPILPRLKQKLESMDRMGITAPVQGPSEWCAGMVAPLKKNGEPRICVDLTALNKSVLREIHPMASVDSNLAKLCGGKIFTKLDANAAFWQAPLHESSQDLTTFITPFGRRKFLRLPYGIRSAPEIYQKIVSEMLEGLPGVVIHMDDVLVFGGSVEEHNQRVRAVLQRMLDKGMTLNKEKCEFSRPSVTFLGHVVSERGIEADPEKVRAVKDFPAPTCIQELQRFNGMVNQLAKFTAPLAKVNEPLRQLLRRDSTWLWDSPQEKAFQAVKDLLISSEVLAHYDPGRSCIIAADACGEGLGGVLLQQDSQGVRRPIFYASRSLTDTEKRYAVIEKEALAATWACEKFSDYITGNTLTVETDHRPLVPLLSSTDLSKLPPRILRFRLRIMKYSPDVKYVQGSKQLTADALSRAPTSSPEAKDINFVQEVEDFKDSLIKQIAVSDRRLQEILEAQQSDAICQEVKKYVLNGWPPVQPHKPILQPFYEKREHLSVEKDLLLYDTRLVVPQSLQLAILEALHEGHLGMNKCKGRAMNTVWWPGITKQVEAMCAKCVTCMVHRPVPREPLIPYAFPDEAPWTRVGTDLFEFAKETYVIVVDYTSRWFEFRKLAATSSLHVIAAIQAIFATHGIPKVVVSDNGPQYSCGEFENFARNWGFIHVTSSPRHPMSNGEAERAVQTTKNILKKNVKGDLNRALLAYRSAPLQNGLSPSEILMNRRLRTTLPVLSGNLVPSVTDLRKVAEKEARYREGYARNHDRRHKVIQMPVLEPGDRVFVKDQGRYGTVEVPLAQPRSYRITTDAGTRIQRNRKDLVHTGTHNPAPPALQNSGSKEQNKRNEIISTEISAERNVDTRSDPTKSPRMSSFGRPIKTPSRFNE